MNGRAAGGAWGGHRQLAASARRPRGHGIIFMHALIDEVTIDPAARGTTVTLTKDLKPQ